MAGKRGGREVSTLSVGPPPVVSFLSSLPTLLFSPKSLPSNHSHPSGKRFTFEFESTEGSSIFTDYF